MASTVPGSGTVLQATIGGSLTTVAQRVSIDGPDRKVGSKETTHLDSRAKEFRPTLPEAGPVSFQVWYDPSDPTHDQMEIWAGMSPPPVVNWKLIFNSSPVKSYLFAGFLTGFKNGGMDPEGYLTADCEMMITGLITKA